MILKPYELALVRYAYLPKGRPSFYYASEY